MMARRGSELLSFLAGLLVGMTLVQLYFHRFSVPLESTQSPSGPTSPIKTMSYAMQARPALAWRELLVVAALLLWPLYEIATA